MLGLTLRQNDVDAGSIHIDHLESPARPHGVISRFRQFMQLREDEPRQGHILPRRGLSDPEELHHIGEGDGRVDEIRAVLTPRDFRSWGSIDFR